MQKKGNSFLIATMMIGVICLFLCNGIVCDTSFVPQGIASTNSLSIPYGSDDILGLRNWDIRRIEIATISLLEELVPGDILKGDSLSLENLREHIEKNTDWHGRLRSNTSLIPCIYGTSLIDGNWSIRWWVVDEHYKEPRTYIARFSNNFKPQTCKVEVFPELGDTQNNLSEAKGLPETRASNRKASRVCVVDFAGTRMGRNHGVIDPLDGDSLVSNLNTEFNQISTTLVAPHMYEDIDELIDAIINTKPDILTLILAWGTFDNANKIINSLNQLPIEQRPLIAIGGIVGAHNHSLLLNRYPHSIIFFDNGQLSTASLIRYFDGEIMLRDACNIAYRNTEGNMRYSTRKAQESLCAQKRVQIDAIKACGGRGYVKTSEGCRSQCTYCELCSYSRRVTVKKPLDSIIAEITLLDKKGFKKIHFKAPDFIDSDTDKGTRLAKAVLDLKRNGDLSKDLTFYAEFTVRSIYDSTVSSEENQRKKEMMRLLIEAGLRGIFIGVESGCPERLLAYKKPVTVEETEEAIKILREYGITDFRIGFIMFHPELEDPNEIIRNIDFLRRNRLELAINNSVHQMRILNRTALKKTLEDKGLLIQGSYDPTWLTFDWMYQNIDIANIAHYAKEFESDLIFVVDYLKLVQRAEDFMSYPKELQEYNLTNRREINILFLNFLYDLAFAVKDGKTVSNVMNTHTEKAILYLNNILKEVGDKLNFSDDAKKVLESAKVALLKKIIFRYYRYKNFTPDNITKYCAMAPSEIKSILAMMILKEELHKTDDNAYRTTNKFFKLNLVRPVDYPKRPKVVMPEDIEKRLISLSGSHKIVEELDLFGLLGKIYELYPEYYPYFISNRDAGLCKSLDRIENFFRRDDLPNDVDKKKIIIGFIFDRIASLRDGASEESENSRLLGTWMASECLAALEDDKNNIKVKSEYINELDRAVAEAEKLHKRLIKKSYETKTRVIVDEGMFRNGEFEKDITGHFFKEESRYVAAGDICILEKCNTKDAEDILGTLRRTSHFGDRTIVQVSRKLSEEDIRMLEKESPEGVRFMRIDTNALTAGGKYDNERDKEIRWKMRFNLYAMLLAARDITNEDLTLKEASSVYRLFHFFLKKHGAKDPYSYLEEFTRDNLSCLTKYALSFVPSERLVKEARYYLIGIREIAGAA